MIKNHNSSILPYNSKTNKYLNDFTNSNNSILNINAFRSNNTSVLKLKQYKLEKNKRRVNSCMKSFRTYNKNNSNIKKEKTTQSLNSLNTILKNCPKKADMSLIAQKINTLNKKNPLNLSLSQKFNESNINSIIHYSPKSKSRINLNINKNEQVFTEYEIIELFNHKCKDLDVPVKEELMNRFISFIQEKCVNRIIDLNDCCLGFNAMIALSEILKRNNDICSRLILTKNNFGDMGIELLIEKIKNNSNIVELNLCSNNLGVKGGIIIFNYLLNQNSIISLDLSSKEGIYRNRICAEGVKTIEKVLKTNFYLEKIDLSSNSLRNEGFKYLTNGLEKNSSLQTLIISNNEINEKGIIYMESKLIECKIKYLDISCNPISNNGLIIIAKCLSNKKLNEITYLNISDCSLNFDGFREFIKKLSKNHKIITLNFNKNNLFSNKWESLENAFSGMALKNLSLGSCRLGPVIKDISHVFKRNATIKYLDLSHNQINDYEFEYFQEYPLHNLSLEEIDFSNNFISDKSAAIFFKNLMFNNSLQRLNFYDNQLQNESANIILDVVKKNHNIININVKCNRIGIKMMNEIKSQIINNKLIEKEKFLPKLKDELRGLEFNPMEIQILRNRIINSNKERENLSKKFSQEIKEFSLKKKKKIEEVKNVDNIFSQVEKETKKYDKKIKYIIEEKNNENDFFNKNINIMKDKIFLIKKDIKEIKYKQNSIKREQEEEIKLLKDTYEITLNKEQQMKISISTITKQLESLKEKYQEKINYLIKMENAKKDLNNDRKESIRENGGNKKIINRNNSKNKDVLNSVQKRKKVKKEEEISINKLRNRRRSQSTNIKVKKDFKD